MCVSVQFVLRTRPDKRFIRQGNDLLYNATITLVDALLGFSVKVSFTGTRCQQSAFLLVHWLAGWCIEVELSCS